MGTYSYSLRRYFRMSRKEWLSILLVSFAIAFILSYNDWGAQTFDLAAGLTALLTAFVAAVLVVALHVSVNKAIAVYYGVWSDFEHYGLGLLTGVFIAFLSFGYLPIWVTGYFRYKAIPNLRLGKFRGTLVKPWEEGLITAGTVLTHLLVTIPLGLLYNLTGIHIFLLLITINLLVALYTLIPLPLIQTTNVYQVYMSRLESMEGNLPGFDLFWASPTYYFGILFLTVGFALFTWIFGPTTLTLLLGLLFGFIGFWVWARLRDIQRL